MKPTAPTPAPEPTPAPVRQTPTPMEIATLALKFLESEQAQGKRRATITDECRFEVTAEHRAANGEQTLAPRHNEFQRAVTQAAKLWAEAAEAAERMKTAAVQLGSMKKHFLTLPASDRSAKSKGIDPITPDDWARMIQEYSGDPEELRLFLHCDRVPASEVAAKLYRDKSLSPQARLGFLADLIGYADRKQLKFSDGEPITSLKSKVEADPERSNVPKAMRFRVYNFDPSRSPAFSVAECRRLLEAKIHQEKSNRRDAALK